MKQELDKLLCEKYPKMMVNRNKNMQETCMCWGFECGDGWFNILNQLMSQIQHHIDWKEKQRAGAIKYNEMAAQAKAGNFDLFEETMKALPNDEYKEKRLAEIAAGDFAFWALVQNDDVIDWHFFLFWSVYNLTIFY